MHNPAYMTETNPEHLRNLKIFKVKKDLQDEEVHSWKYTPILIAMKIQECLTVKNTIKK